MSCGFLAGVSTIPASEVERGVKRPSCAHWQRFRSVAVALAPSRRLSRGQHCFLRGSVGVSAVRVGGSELMDRADCYQCRATKSSVPPTPICLRARVGRWFGG
jgi:hypothetical protein